MTPWLKNVTPHQGIRDGVLDESVFAADFSEVAIGKGRPVYAKPELFFSKPYFTVGLKTICRHNRIQTFCFPTLLELMRRVYLFYANRHLGGMGKREAKKRLDEIK